MPKRDFNKVALQLTPMPKRNFNKAALQLY